MGDSTGHRAHAEKWSHAWLGVCEDCDLLSEDYPHRPDLARRDASMHGRGERHSWRPEKMVEWDQRKGDPAAGTGG
jgi:hypothetical protein